MVETYQTKTIKVGNCIVNIHQPILSDQERRKREEHVVSALRLYGRSVFNKEREKK